MPRSRPIFLSFLLAALFVVAMPTLGLAADDHAKESAPNILEPRLDLTIWTVIVFAVLLLVLRKYAWGPMLAGLQGREARIRGALDEANSARDDAHKLRDQFKTEMDKVQDKMRELMDEARRDGQQVKERLLAEGKADIHAEKERSLREIEATRDQAKQELWNQTAQLATLVSAKAIGRNMTVDDHRHLVDQALAELTGATGRQTA